MVSIDRITKTMVIDWGNGTILNHYIPKKILSNPEISKEDAYIEIEKMKPEIPDPIDIPIALQNIYEETNQNPYNQGDDGETVI